jgi:hypothetical protein
MRLSVFVDPCEAQCQYGCLCVVLVVQCRSARNGSARLLTSRPVCRHVRTATPTCVYSACNAGSMLYDCMVYCISPTCMPHHHVPLPFCCGVGECAPASMTPGFFVCVHRAACGEYRLAVKLSTCNNLPPPPMPPVSVGATQAGPMHVWVYVCTSLACIVLVVVGFLLPCVAACGQGLHRAAGPTGLCRPSTAACDCKHL